MIAFLSPLLAVALLLAAVPQDPPQDPPPPPGQCPGCSAEKVTDPVSGMADGVHVITQVPGVTVHNLELFIRPGNCLWVEQPNSSWICAANNNCRFTAFANVHSVNGPFRDDWVGPCHRSVASTVPQSQPPVASQKINVYEEWLGACNGAVTTIDRSFYGSFTSCTDGTLICRIQFSGKCNVCPP